jgi:large subunit ribosomal protein LP0
MSEEKAPNEKRLRKMQFRERMERYFDEYKSILVIGVDNVGSNMLQQVRIALRGKASILMGKNTLMRMIVRERAEKDPKFEPLIECLRGNVGFLFTNGDLNEIRKVVMEFKVPAAAKSGAFAPVDVWVPKGPSGLDPGNTAFFQALNIATKIARGAIEIVNDVHLIKKGERVNASATALLTKLGIKPFFYGIKVEKVFDNGCVYDAAVLDLSQDDLMAKFWSGVNMVASVSLAIGYPTLASIPHSFANAFKQLVAISVMTDYTFPEAQIFKDYLADPSAFASAAPAQSAAGPAAAAAAAPEPEPEEEEEDMGFSLFD